jgi:hypothetical protein
MLIPYESASPEGRVGSQEGAVFVSESRGSVSGIDQDWGQ